MKNLFGCATMLAMILLAWSADGAIQVKKKAPVKKGAPNMASTGKRKSSSGKKSVATSSTSLRGRKSLTKSPARHATTWRNRQLAPSADRYREIQQALAGKGYMKTEDATGNWNAASGDALKKFQSEQNLDASGKINSLSLIALGLGPKREAVAAPAPPKAPPEADQTGR